MEAAPAKVQRPFLAMLRLQEQLGLLAAALADEGTAESLGVPLGQALRYLLDVAQSAGVDLAQANQMPDDVGGAPR